MKSPRQRFQETQHRQKLEAIVHDHFFQYALEAALCQMIAEQPLQTMGKGETDSVLATANAFRIEGARRFIAILTSLPIVQQATPKPQFNDNLEP